MTIYLKEGPEFDQPGRAARAACTPEERERMGVVDSSDPVKHEDCYELTVVVEHPGHIHERMMAGNRARGWQIAEVTDLPDGWKRVRAVGFVRREPVNVG